MAYKMKGFSGFKGSPAKQKNKGKLQGPIPEQNIGLQPGEDEGAWIYGRGYKGEDPKKGLEQMKKTKQRPGGADFVKSERIIDYDERAGVLEQNELQESDEYLGGGDAKKGAEKRKQIKETIKKLDHEAQLMRDRS